jgi:hypothetical protein
MPNLSGDRMLGFDSGGDGSFTLGVPVQEDGVYAVKIWFVRAEDYGIVEVRINGRPAGEPVDAFYKTEELTRPIWPPRVQTFSDVPLKAGLNAFEFTIRSKNPGSAGYRMALDCLVAEKVQFQN